MGVTTQMQKKLTVREVWTHLFLKRKTPLTWKKFTPVKTGEILNQRKQVHIKVLNVLLRHILFGGFSNKLNVTVTNGPKPFYVFLHYQKRKRNGSTNTFGEMEMSVCWSNWGKKTIKSHSGVMTRRFDLQFFPPPPYQGNIYLLFTITHQRTYLSKLKMEDTMQIIWNSLNPFCGLFWGCIVIGLNMLSSDIMAKSGP